MKKCSVCQSLKTHESFHVWKYGSDGFRSQCKDCRKSELQKYYFKNKSKIINRVSDYKKDNSIKVKTWAKKFRKKHKEKLALKNKAYRKINQQSVNRWARSWKRKKRLVSPHFAIESRLRATFTQAIRRQLTKKANTTFKLLDCTIDEFMIYLQKKFKPGMSWSNRHLWHIDHIKPCARFDLKDPEQQKKCFHYLNFQPPWSHENLQKWKHFEEEVAS